MPGADAEFVARGTECFNMGFDGARRSLLFLGEIGVDLREWGINRRANARRFFSRPEGLNSVAVAAVFLEDWACQRERQRQEH